MLELLKAIKTTFTANATLSAYVTGGIWYSEAPQNATMPYITVHGIAMTPKRYLSDELEEDARIQFSLWSSTRDIAQIGNMYEYLNDCFDETDIAIDNFENIRLEREMVTPPMRVDSDIWHMAVDYRWYVQHSLGIGQGGYNEGEYNL
jgi:hypothetical protein